MHRYDFALAAAGFAASFVFLIFAGVMLYGAAYLLAEKGGWQTVAAILLVGVAIWGLYVGCSVVNHYVVQR